MSDPSGPPASPAAPSPAAATDRSTSVPPSTAPPLGGTLYRAQLPRAGELSPPWRIGTALLWIAVVVALAAVWNASVQLGLSTWWLGPRGRPEPLAIRLGPFVAPAVMLLATINRVRWLPWGGLGSAAVIVAIGAGDLGRVTSIGVVEILIGVAAAAVSAASLTGMYRLADPAVGGADASPGTSAS